MKNKWQKTHAHVGRGDVDGLHVWNRGHGFKVERQVRQLFILCVQIQTGQRGRVGEKSRIESVGAMR